MTRQKHEIIKKHGSGFVRIHFETEGPPDWGENMPNPDMITLGVEETEANDVTFTFWYQLERPIVAKGNTLLHIENVISYCFDVVHSFIAIVWVNDQAPDCLEMTVLNAKHLVGWGAQYAPDHPDVTFGLMRTPNGLFFNEKKEEKEI